MDQTVEGPEDKDARELHDDKAAIDCVHRGERVCLLPPNPPGKAPAILWAPGLTWEQAGVQDTACSGD